MRTALLVSLTTLLLGCAAKTPNGKASEVVATKPPEAPVKTYPRSTHYAPKLWSLLEASNAPRERGEDGERITLFDLQCALDTKRPQNPWPPNCQFRKDPRGPATALVASAEVRTLLLGMLFEFPVLQGDGGAATPQVQCRKQGTWAHCEIGIQMDYDGP